MNETHVDGKWSIFCIEHLTSFMVSGIGDLEGLKVALFFLRELQALNQPKPNRVSPIK
jgi:hypothetical protein